MAYDTLSPYAGAYPQTKEELDAQNALTRDVGVGGLRGLTRLTGIADIPTAVEWLGRESGGIQALSSVLPHLDRLDDSDASYLHNLYLRSMGARGDTESQEKAKKLINPLRGEFHNRVEDIIDTIIPFETTERSEIIELGATLMGLGLGIKQIGAMIWRNRKNIPLLLDKMKNAIRKKQDPKASQYPIQQQFDARIDKTVERATTGYDRTTPRPRTRPKTGEEIKQNLDHELAIVGARYDQELTAIHNSPPAGKMTPEKTDQLEKLRRKQKSIYAEIEKQMAEDFAYLEELAFDEKLITTPEHFQGLKETQYSNYTVKMLGDESNKLQRWVEKELKKSLEESKKAGQEVLAKTKVKIKKAKNETEKDTIMAEFKAELNRIDETKALRDKEIDHVFYEKYNELKDALNSIGREMDLLESGAVTRHSRGGLVENKVNYALNQWK